MGLKKDSAELPCARRKKTQPTFVDLTAPHATPLEECMIMAALCLSHSQTALGAYYRQVARRSGGDVAVFATARKLATWIYRLLRWGHAYVDEGAAEYELRYQKACLARLGAIAAQLGFQLTPRAKPV
jgi:hypothetical protein